MLAAAISGETRSAEERAVVWPADDHSWLQSAVTADGTGTFPAGIGIRLGAARTS